MSFHQPHEESPPQAHPGSGVRKSRFFHMGRRVPAHRGLAWIREGWHLFKKRPWLWLGMLLVVVWGIKLLFFIFAWVVQKYALSLWAYFSPALFLKMEQHRLVSVAMLAELLSGILATIPVTVLASLTVAGLLIGCRAQHRGQPFLFKHLFAGVMHHRKNLIWFGVLWGTCRALLAYLPSLSSHATVWLMPEWNLENPETWLNYLLLLQQLLRLLTFGVDISFVWFAPALIVFHEYSALHAIRTNFRALLKNSGAFAVFGISVLILLAPVLLSFLFPAALLKLYASLLTSLGLLSDMKSGFIAFIVLPFIFLLLSPFFYFPLWGMFHTTMYMSYRDVFRAEISDAQTKQAEKL